MKCSAPIFYDYTHLYWTIRYTCAYKFLRTRAITNIRDHFATRNKMADYRVLVKYGNAIAIFEKRQINDQDTEPVSMTSLSRSCATSRLEPAVD